MSMLMPDVTEIINDPDLGGGVSFVVVRQSKKRTLIAGGSGHTAVEKHQTTGNVQPAQTQDLQLLPEEQRSSKVIVIRSLFSFQLGVEGSNASYDASDLVIFDGEVYKVVRIDNWSNWGFQTVYASLQKGVSPDDFD